MHTISIAKYSIGEDTAFPYRQRNLMEKVRTLQRGSAANGVTWTKLMDDKFTTIVVIPSGAEWIQICITSNNYNQVIATLGAGNGALTNFVLCYLFFSNLFHVFLACLWVSLCCFILCCRSLLCND